MSDAARHAEPATHRERHPMIPQVTKKSPTFLRPLADAVDAAARFEGRPGSGALLAAYEQPVRVGHDDAMRAAVAAVSEYTTQIAAYAANYPLRWAAATSDHPHPNARVVAHALALIGCARASLHARDHASTIPPRDGDDADTWLLPVRAKHIVATIDVTRDLIGVDASTNHLTRAVMLLDAAMLSYLSPAATLHDAMEDVRKVDVVIEHLAATDIIDHARVLEAALIELRAQRLSAL